MIWEHFQEARNTRSDFHPNTPSAQLFLKLQGAMKT